MSTHGGGRGRVIGWGLACVALAQVAATVAEAQSLRRDLSSYVVFALKNANVKDLDVLGPCNTLAAAQAVPPGIGTPADDSPWAMNPALQICLW